MAKETKGAKRPRTGEERFAAYLDGISAVLGHASRAASAQAYCTGLLLPGERKSVQPMAARVAPGDLQQLHHVISTSPWRCEPLEEELVRAARLKPDVTVATK